jgi:adenylosuccinate lyase
MIERYTRPEMGEIWSDESRFSKWLEIEILACEARAQQGLLDKESLQTIKRKAAFDVERINEIEEVTRHDVIAFLSAVAEKVGPESRHIHIGLTSSDLLDTCFAMQLVEACGILIADVEKLSEVLKRRAYEHKNTVMIGRSHGIHAEPITFGLVLTNWYAEAQRNLKRLKTAREEIAVGKISGAVGTFANSEPEIEQYVCEKLGLVADPISTQIVQRGVRGDDGKNIAQSAAFPTYGSARSGGVFPQGPKGQLGHAAQTQSDSCGKPLRPGPCYPWQRHVGPRKRSIMA